MSGNVVQVPIFGGQMNVILHEMTNSALFRVKLGKTFGLARTGSNKTSRRVHGRAPNQRNEPPE